MKISKDYLKKLIQEELNKLSEADQMQLPFMQQKPDAAQQKAQKDSLVRTINMKKSQLDARKKEIVSLETEIKNLNDQLASMGG